MKTTFKCSECSYTTVKWLGCCPECKSWDSLVENVSQTKEIKKSTSSSAQLISLSSVDTTDQPRILSGIGEWDRVVGDGLVPGSLIVVTGDPGIGKSTLLMQIAANIAQKLRVFYYSTEESLQQIKQRIVRINQPTDNLLFSTSCEISQIIESAQSNKADLILIDSIQNCYVDGALSSPGSIGQLREIVFQLMRMSKERNITTIITGHITKEGIIAGPKTLEHMVDAVFYLIGEDRWETRMLRAVKNRFGAINELGFFHMQQDGMREVPNINAHLINDLSNSPGSALISVMEGSRPLLLELQALTNPSKLVIPQRVIFGLDHKQVVLVAAILEKYIKIKLSAQDIFFKVSGGFKIKGSESDLGIALALLSSYFQETLPEKSIALGEISLTGQIKPVNQIDALTGEAQKFGVTHFFVAKTQQVKKTACTIKRFSNVYELLSLFGQ